MNADFRDVLLAMVGADVEFIVVGAYALAFHGVPRATGDIDILIRPSPENATRVHAALTSFGAPLGAAGVSIQDFATPGSVYQIGVPPRRVDVLTEISGISFDDAWASRVETELEGRVVPLLGRAAMIQNRLATGRTKDRADVEELER